MKNYLILSALLAFVPVAAQTSLGDYRQAVTEYSWELKVAASKSDAASQTMGQARTGYLPRLSLDGSFTATVHHYDGVERWNFSVLPQLVQTVYGGGAVRAAYKQAELGYDIALCDEEFTQLDVRYAAEYTYWNLSAMELYAASMRQYVNIIRSLKEVVDRRFAEGYIAKGDVLMIDARLSEAQYGLVSAEQNYTVALHNFNILRGTDPDLAVELAQGIRDSLPQPVRVLPDEVLGRRPDYMAARLRSEQADAGIRAARAPFNPQVSVGIGGSWQPYFPNRTGATTVDGSVFVKLTLPIFHWGERRRATGAARAVQRQSEWNTALLHDNIVRDEMNGWTALVNSRAQVDATEQSLRIAGENLDISTYSYGEGLSTILDVLPGLDDRGMHPLPDIDPDLIGQEVDQRQVAVAIVSQIHREEEKGDGKHDFQGVEGEDLVGAVTPPDHQGHRQQRQVLVESLPRRQLQRLAETTAVLDGDHRSAEQGEGGKKEHGKHGEDRDQADTYLEEEHTAHHHLGTAQPDRKGHARPLEGFHPVDGKILVDLHGGAPRIDDLREARHDERAGKDQPADIGQQFKGPGLPHRLRVLVPAGHIF